MEAYKKDVYAEGKVKLAPAVADNILLEWNQKDSADEYKRKKKVISG